MLAPKPWKACTVLTWNQSGIKYVMAGFNYAIRLIFLLISFRVAGALEAIQAIVEGKAEYNPQFISLFQANV